VPRRAQILPSEADGRVRIDDIRAVPGRYFEVCPDNDTVVAQATLAAVGYRDQGAAAAGGYVQGTQSIRGHGIHWIN
jgi:hypothetical protein